MVAEERKDGEVQECYCIGKVHPIGVRRLLIIVRSNENFLITELFWNGKLDCYARHITEDGG